MSTAVKWGLITGMVYVLQNLISNLLGFGPGGTKGMGLNFLISAIGLVATFFTIYYGIKEIRDTELNGAMNMGLALRKGMKIALIAGIIVAVFTFIYTQFIDPDMMSRIVAMQEDQMREKNMSDEQIAMAQKFSKIFTSPVSVALFSIIGTCFWGLFQSLISGAILKKDAPPTMPPTAPIV